MCEKDLEALFGKGAQLSIKELSQPGQYASNERVTLVGPKGEMKVTILGPTRKSTQVEISMTDARSLGLAAPVRESGDTAGSAAAKLIGPAGEWSLQRASSSPSGISTPPPRTRRRWASMTRTWCR